MSENNQALFVLSTHHHPHQGLAGLSLCGQKSGLEALAGGGGRGGVRGGGAGISDLGALSALPFPICETLDT